MARRLGAWRARVIGLLAVIMLPRCVEQPRSIELELGVELRLNGVALHYSYSYDYDPNMMAVGEQGQVAWRLLDDDASLQNWSLGAARLHDVDYADSFDSLDTLWFVVGAGGTIYIGRQQGEDFTWIAQDTGVTADLHALEVFDQSDAATARVLVVGDEVVLIGQAGEAPGTFAWTSVPPPAGGWGRLRAITRRSRSIGEGYDDYVSEAIVAGAGGRAWVSDLDAAWQAIELGTDRDIHDGGGWLCGEAGTIVDCRSEGCSTTYVGTTDFVSCRDEWWVDARARILRAHPERDDEAHDQLSWQPRAAAGHLFEMVFVGDGGRAIRWASDVRYCE